MSLNKTIFIGFFLLSCLACSKTSNQNEELSESTWTISYFWDQQDKTLDYAPFYFMFNDDGILMAHKGQQLTVGRWSTSGNIFSIYFESNELLLNLSKNWQIVEKTSAIIKLIDNSVQPARELHFIKG
jgi:hypothetical protein